MIRLWLCSGENVQMIRLWLCSGDVFGELLNSICMLILHKKCVQQFIISNQSVDK